MKSKKSILTSLKRISLTHEGIAATCYDRTDHLRTPEEIAAYLTASRCLFYVIIDLDHVSSSPGTRYRLRNASFPNALSAENLVLAAEPEREVEKEARMFDVPAEGSLMLVAEPEREVKKEARMSDCSIEGEDQC
jgi:hypothetical protein